MSWFLPILIIIIEWAVKQCNLWWQQVSFLTLYMYLQCVDFKSEPLDSVWGIGGHYLNWTPQERQTPLLPSITESVPLTALRCQYVYSHSAKRWGICVWVLCTNSALFIISSVILLLGLGSSEEEHVCINALSPLAHSHSSHQYIWLSIYLVYTTAISSVHYLH